jgi:hypothetical protein
MVGGIQSAKMYGRPVDFCQSACFFSISALFAPNSNPSPIGLNVRRFNLCPAESFGTASSEAALDTVTPSQLCKYIHEIRIALWSSAFFVLRKMEPVAVFRALVTALE